MTEYREILRLRLISQRNIADCLPVRAIRFPASCSVPKELNLSWPLSPETAMPFWINSLSRQVQPFQTVASRTWNTSTKGDPEEWCDPEAALERVLRRVQCRERTSAYVLSVLLLLSALSAHQSNDAYPQETAKKSRSTGRGKRRPSWITYRRNRVYIFVGVLPTSQYAYVEACHIQNLESWIAAHIPICSVLWRCFSHAGSRQSENRC